MKTGSHVAFLGTGLMGLPMALRLIGAEHTVAVWNRTPEKAAPLVKHGAKFCPDAADAVNGAKFICLCLTDKTAVEEVVFGPAVAGISRDAIVIDFSTIGVEATRAFAAQLESQTGAAWLDCPVSGGVAGATAGTLSIFVGGEGRVLEEARPLLAKVSARATYMGGSGAGQAAKLCNQLIVSATLAAIAEALALAGKLGVDASSLVGAFSGGFADSRPLQIFGPRMAQADDPGPKVSEINIMMKDIDAVADSAAPMQTPLLDCIGTLYRQLVDAGLGSEDLPALIKPYREREDTHG